MSEVETKPQYIYAIRNKETGEIINRKCRGNPFYVNKGAAKNKVYENEEEIVSYELKEINS